MTPLLGHGARTGEQGEIDLEYTKLTNLEVTGELKMSGTAVMPAATATALGGVKQAAKVSEAAGDSPTAAEFKALLDALKAAGIMAAS
jgi:hypothetical protein